MNFAPLKHLLTALPAIMLAGCAATSTVDDIADAQSLLEGGDTESAQEICDIILARTDSATVGPRAYGMLSLTYMRLAETSNQDDNIANAAISYRRAYNLDADSAAAYYGSLSGDDLMRLSMLSTIARSFGRVHEVIPEVTDSFDFDTDTLNHTL